MTEKRLDKLLVDPGSALADLARSAADACSLTNQARAALEPGLRPRLTAAALHDGELTLSAASSAWASRLRYAAPEIVDALRANGHRIVGVKIRVAPGANAPPPAQA